MPTSSFNRHFPGYEILGELGRSNARVLKARNLATGELVAIKHFSFNTDASTLQRFQQESEIMTTIKNYNIVKVKEIQLDSDFPFMAMEFIEGGDLRSLLKEHGNLDIATTIRVGLQMTEAFKTIHQQGIIHRDIKPENIMYRVLHSGELHFLLTDFGIAKVRAQSVTVTGQSMMTYEYASPEQFDNPRNVTAATDYYSLGVVLYECLSGKPPFELKEERVHSFINQVMAAPPPPLSLPAGMILPASLKALVNGLLEKTVENRVKDELSLKRKLKRAEMEEVEDPSENVVHAHETHAAAAKVEEPVKAEIIKPAVDQKPKAEKIDVPKLSVKTEKSSGGIGTLLFFAGAVILIILKLSSGLWSGDSKSSAASPDSAVSKVDSVSKRLVSESKSSESRPSYKFALPGSDVKKSLSDTTYKTGLSKPKVLGSTLISSGTLNETNGKYFGGLFNGRKNGEGTFYYNSGARYEGNWLLGDKSGYGKMRYTDSCSYEGNWSRGMRNGKGKLIFENGAWYDGDWIDDKKSGEGTFRYVGGNKYTGKFSNDLRNGSGVFRVLWGDVANCPNCAVYSGNWKDDKKEGYGRCYTRFTDKLLYEGNFSNDRPDGPYPNR